jgi:hypothetical protein
MVAPMAIRYLRAEKRMSDAIRRGGPLSEDDRRYLREQFGWDAKYTDQQFARLKRVRRLQAIGGTPLDRELLRREVIEMESLVETISNADQKQKFQWQIVTARRRLGEMEAAAIALSKPQLAPPHAGPEYNQCQARHQLPQYH